MLGSIGKQIKGYLILLTERPLTKRRRKKLAKKGKITLETHGLDLKALGEGKGKQVVEQETVEKTGQQVTRRKRKWYTPHEFCLNCGEKLQGKYCYNCGQKDSDFRRPYWTFLEDFTENVISRDSRLWRTLAYLLFLPGAMTREFIAGRRIRFLPPIRLFLVSILLFFLTVNLLDVAIIKLEGIPITYDARLTKLKKRLVKDEKTLAATDPEDRFDYRDAVDDVEDTKEDIARLDAWHEEQLSREDQDQVRRTKQGDLIYDYDVDFHMFSKITKDDEALPEDIIEKTFQFDTDTNNVRITVTSTDEESDSTDEVFQAEAEEAAATVEDKIDGFFEDLEPKLKRGLKNWAEDPKRMNNALNNWVPVVMIVFVFLTAIFLRFYYWKREHYLYNHLVFSLHFHTYIFFVLTFFVLATVLIGSSVSTWAFAGAVPLYFFVALKVATRQGWFRTSFKFLVIFLFYSIGFSLMLSAILVASLSEA